MKKDIVFTLDWDFGYKLNSSSRGLGGETDIQLAGYPIKFFIKQTKNRIEIQADLLDWARAKNAK